MPRVRWSSNKGNSGTTRIVLAGSASDPEREIQLGGEGELTDEELSRYGKRHQFDVLEESAQQEPEQEPEESEEEEQPEEEVADPPSKSSKKTKRERR